ncbi:MAG: hypothetical protein J1F11_10395 [Oscillospiraceae bacterium]|nr:hypothetical protein [Oscillospiraceae bacterium]
MGLKSGVERLPSFDGWARDIRANYGGSDRKDGLLGLDGSRYMVKYSEKQAPRNDLATRYVNNAVSEYISSHVLGILGYPVHDTELGTLGGEIVVVCRNFVPPGGELLEFGIFMRKHYESGAVGRIPDIGQIYEVFEIDPVLSAQADLFKSCYWERFVGDALVGNFDRHKDNFGYLIGSDDSVTASPIYDNGGTLFPNLSESDMQTVIADPKEIMQRIKLYQKAALEMNRMKVGYYDMMSSGIYSELTNAVVRTVPRIRKSMPVVRDFIDGCSFLSDTRKDFYKVMLAERMHFILEPAYKRCSMQKFDPSARKRIEDGTEFSREDFENYWEQYGRTTYEQGCFRSSST